MENKNIKNKPQNCGRWLFLHSRFSKFPPDTPPRTHTHTHTYKGNTSTKPSKSFFNNNSSQRQNKEPESPPPLKQSTRNLSLGYTEIEKKGGGRWGKIFFVWCVIGLFETLICAIAEDKVCDSCIVSSWAFLIFLLCNDQIQISCVVRLRKTENLAVTFCYLWLTEKAWLLGDTAPLPPPPPEPPFNTLITLLKVTFSQLDPQLGVGWGKRFVIHVILAWNEIGRSSLLGREIGAPDREVFSRRKKKLFPAP